MYIINMRITKNKNNMWSILPWLAIHYQTMLKEQNKKQMHISKCENVQAVQIYTVVPGVFWLEFETFLQQRSKTN